MINTLARALILLLASLVLLLSNCKSDTQSSYTDLMQYGMPIKIKAPADAVYTSDDLGFMKDITVKSGNDYSIQILSGQAIDRDVSNLVMKQKFLVQIEDYFDSITEEYDGGFIYKKNIDGTEDYDFRYIKVVGDNEYLFQTGLVGTYTLEQVKTMLESVK